MVTLYHSILHSNIKRVTYTDDWHSNFFCFIAKFYVQWKASKVVFYFLPKHDIPGSCKKAVFTFYNTTPYVHVQHYKESETPPKNNTSVLKRIME